MKINRFVLGMLFLSAATVLSAQKSIQLEDIFRKYTFSPRYVPGFNFMEDGRHFTRLESNAVMQYDLTSGQLNGLIFEGYSQQGVGGFNGQIGSYAFGPSEQLLIIQSEVERIYRRSSKAHFFIFNRESETFSKVFDQGKIMYATLSPDASKIAFVFENNLYFKDLVSEEVTQVTTDGTFNEIINGGSDWVYEEEFSMTRSFEWSPDSRRIAFLRFDESKVKEFTMTHYRGELYPEYETFKYPKVGEDNSEVSVHLYDLESKETMDLDVMAEDTEYIPRIRWTQSPKFLCVMRMNRHQNKLELVLANSETGVTKILYKEENASYIEEAQLDNIVFLENGTQFLTTSEQDGFRHLYVYNLDGELEKQITKGDWEVTTFYGVDEKNGRVYYQAAQESPLQRQIYSENLDGSGRNAEAGNDGWNTAQFSSTFDYYVLNHSSANTPPTIAVYNKEGNMVRQLEENDRLLGLMEEYKPEPLEFFEFETAEGVELNGYMIKPPNFEASKKYPVFMYLYGGPGSQQVTDRWGGSRYWWFQMLAQQGFIVACVDNRGTGGRGEEFKKMTYLQLGHFETLDQIEAAKYLGGLSYTDPSRIGIFGWSYGGYMSSLCLFKGSEVFKAAIAVAPVTSWKWYDTIYTERYMRTLEENREGYENNSPVNFADQLKGNYLLVHGMGDDNVHFQNSAEMVNALVDANKQFDTYYYPNRNHGIYGGNTTLHLYTKMTNFLRDKLMNGGMDNDPTASSSRP